jgi:hypothetical protein
MNIADNYAHLWNGSEPGWVLVKHTEDKEELQVVFAATGPSVEQVKALRSALPQFGNQTASQVLTAIRGASTLHLGEFESSRAKQIRKQCESLGLQIEAKGYAVTRYSVVNERTSMYLLIEDEDQKQRVVKEALKNGLPVRQSTV